MAVSIKYPLVPIFEKGQAKNKTWRYEYNKFRLHSSLGEITPNEYHIKTSKNPFSNFGQW